MVLSTRLKDERMAGRAEGRAEGHAAGLEEGRQEGLTAGREERDRENALKMLKYNEPLSKILIYSDLSKEEVYALAKENGLNVVE